MRIKFLKKAASNPIRYRGIRVLAGCFSLVLVFFAGGGPELLFGGTDRALVLRRIGDVKFRVGKGPWRPLRVNAVVPDKSYIKTGAGAKVIILYNNSQIRLGERTMIRIASLKERKPVEIHLIRGMTWFNFKKRKAVLFTPTAIAGVRGTKFALMHDARGSLICMCEGSLDIRARSNKSRGRLITRGESVSIGTKGSLKSKNFSKYFKKRTMDPSFSKSDPYRKDPRLSSCASCHRSKKAADKEKEEDDPDDY